LTATAVGRITSLLARTLLLRAPPGRASGAQSIRPLSIERLSESASSLTRPVPCPTRHTSEEQ